MKRFIPVIIVFAGLLSYQMPVYAARFFGLEQSLDELWAAGMQDAVPAQVLFLIFYMLTGFAIWALPIALLAVVFHAEHGAAIRSALAVPFRPVRLFLLHKWDEYAGALAERKAVREIYEREFKHEFPSFARFRRYYYWVNDQNYTDPRAPMTASSDGFIDAAAFLGLAGSFDQKALNARFGMLMKQVHPDIAGPNDIARRLTEAREIIRARKGWA